MSGAARRVRVNFAPSTHRSRRPRARRLRTGAGPAAIAAGALTRVHAVRFLTVC